MNLLQLKTIVLEELVSLLKEDKIMSEEDYGFGTEPEKAFAYIKENEKILEPILTLLFFPDGDDVFGKRKERFLKQAKEIGENSGKSLDINPDSKAQDITGAGEQIQVANNQDVGAAEVKEVVQAFVSLAPSAIKGIGEALPFVVAIGRKANAEPEEMIERVKQFNTLLGGTNPTNTDQEEDLSGPIPLSQAPNNAEGEIEVSADDAGIEFDDPFKELEDAAEEETQNNNPTAEPAEVKDAVEKRIAALEKQIADLLAQLKKREGEKVQVGAVEDKMSEMITKIVKQLFSELSPQFQNQAADTLTNTASNVVTVNVAGGGGGTPPANVPPLEVEPDTSGSPDKEVANPKEEQPDNWKIAIESFNNFKDKFYCPRAANASDADRERETQECIDRGFATTKKRQGEILNGLMKSLEAIIASEEESAFEGTPGKRDDLNEETEKKISKVYINQYKEDLEALERRARMSSRFVGEYVKSIGKLNANSNKKRMKKQMTFLMQMTGKVYRSLKQIISELTPEKLQEHEIFNEIMTNAERAEAQQKIEKVHKMILGLLGQIMQDLAAGKEKVPAMRQKFEQAKKELQKIMKFFNVGSMKGGSVDRDKISDEYQKALKNFNLDFTKISLLPKKLKAGKGGEGLIDSAAMSILTFAEELNRIFGIKMSDDFKEKIKTPEESEEKQEPEETETERDIKIGQAAFGEQLNDFFQGVNSDVQRSFYWWLGKMHKVLGSGRVFLEEGIMDPIVNKIMGYQPDLKKRIKSVELAQALEEELSLLPEEDKKNIMSVLRKPAKAKEFEEALAASLMKRLKTSGDDKKKGFNYDTDKIKEITTNFNEIKMALRSNKAKFVDLKTLASSLVNRGKKLFNKNYTEDTHNAIIRFFIIMHASVSKKKLKEEEDKDSKPASPGIVSSRLSKIFKNMDWGLGDEKTTAGFDDRYPDLSRILMKMLSAGDLAKDYATTSEIIVSSPVVTKRLFGRLFDATKGLKLNFPIAYMKMLSKFDFVDEGDDNKKVEKSEFSYELNQALPDVQMHKEEMMKYDNLKNLENKDAELFAFLHTTVVWWDDFLTDGIWKGDSLEENEKKPQSGGFKDRPESVDALMKMWNSGSMRAYQNKNVNYDVEELWNKVSESYPKAVEAWEQYFKKVMSKHWGSKPKKKAKSKKSTPERNWGRDQADLARDAAEQGGASGGFTNLEEGLIKKLVPAIKQQLRGK